MIKIGNEKLFTMTETLESLKEYCKNESLADLLNGSCNVEIDIIAEIIQESPDFVYGFVIANRK